MQLTKSYGPNRGIVDVDLRVEPGEVFGFLGPNGAGKTTAMRVVMDFIRPTSGEALIFGLDSRSDSPAIRQRVGYLPGELSLYERMSSRRLFEYLGSLRHIDDLSYAHQLTERLELRIDRPIGQLSRGNKQKVGLIQALMHRPELAILDEPTSGLDPIMQRVFFSVLEELRAGGSTFFLSSHVLAEVRKIADRVGIIADGRLLTVKYLTDLEPVVTLDLRFGEPVPRGMFEGVPGVARSEVRDRQAQVDVVGSVDAALRVATRYQVIDLRSTEASLEEAFVHFVGEDRREH